MSWIRSIARGILPSRARRGLGLHYELAKAAIGARGAKAAASVALFSLRLLPLRARVVVRERLRLVGRLDYRPDHLRLALDSEIEFTMRLHSCRKEPETIAWIESSMRPGDVVYDVGANVGAYSLVVDRHLNGEGRIYAFEPGFANFAQLNRNIILNGSQGRVIPLCVALSDRTALGEFRYSDVATGTAMHSLEHVSAGGQRPSTAAYSQPVFAYRLDDLIEQYDLPKPNHVKLDVDGREVDVLRGAATLLCDAELRSILVEIDPSVAESATAIRAQLEEAGFILRSTHLHGDDPLATRNCVFSR